ncbi:hypothetical protein [Variovorax paradoxus]|uniref:hypothetical protein n=1 Tax=Variovorax paradoxus TaxID=34073 RepID=UPI003ED08C45
MRAANDFERMLAAWAIGGIAVSIIGTLIGLFIMYYVIRLAVRDGMRDAQRGVRESREPARHKHSTAHLPDIRAD